MEVLRLGSRNTSVTRLQEELRELGYFNTNPTGIFGPVTEASVIRFQRENGLKDDGIVGRMTWNAINNLINKNQQNSQSNKIINDTRFVLPSQCFVNERHNKTNIVLHHTNGWVVQRNTRDTPSMTHFDWWVSQRTPVSTAFSIDYKGNIYQHFNPELWAWHIGLGRARIQLERQSIGIELTNEGYLTKDNNNHFFWYSGTVPIRYNRPQDEPVHIKNGWRGYEWYAPYSKEQHESTIWLVNHLCDRFNIRKNVIEHFDFDQSLLNGRFNGIYSHVNVREFPSNRPKWDISPAFDIKDLKKNI